MKGFNSFKHELQNIIIGNGQTGSSDLIKTTQSLLKTGKGTSTTVKARFKTRAEEERALTDFADKNSLWIAGNDLGFYITEGAEQKVYFIENTNYVIKLADAIFYRQWFDYFNNLLLHNVFFPATEYFLKGFLNEKNKLYAVLQQAYVTATELTNIEVIKSFLLENGFINKKNNDYYHPELGIILEDLHDENVLTGDKGLFFVDTVFYITDTFYDK